jgi:hypothetical protein
MKIQIHAGVVLQELNIANFTFLNFSTSTRNNNIEVHPMILAALNTL